MSGNSGSQCVQVRNRPQGVLVVAVEVRVVDPMHQAYRVLQWMGLHINTTACLAGDCRVPDQRSLTSFPLIDFVCLLLFIVQIRPEYLLVNKSMKILIIVVVVMAY